MTKQQLFVFGPLLLTNFPADLKQLCFAGKAPQQLTAVWQKWRFSAPKIVLWLIKVLFSASTFVVKSPPSPSAKTLAETLGELKKK